MLKKLTETAFCVTKNRFFLIRFLICVDRTTARVPSPSRRELAYYNILLLTASSVLMHFFGIFFRFFSELPQAHLSFGQLAYSITLKRESQLFFALFFIFFEKKFNYFFFYNLLCFCIQYATIDVVLYLLGRRYDEISAISFLFSRMPVRSGRSNGGALTKLLVCPDPGLLCACLCRAHAADDQTRKTDRAPACSRVQTRSHGRKSARMSRTVRNLYTLYYI